jgi:hypothetical protein
MSESPGNGIIEFLGNLIFFRTATEPPILEFEANPRFRLNFESLTFLFPIFDASSVFSELLMLENSSAWESNLEVSPLAFLESWIALGLGLLIEDRSDAIESGFRLWIVERPSLLEAFPKFKGLSGDFLGGKDLGGSGDFVLRTKAFFFIS